MKKWICWLLTLCLMLNTFGITALAAEGDAEPVPDAPAQTDEDAAAQAAWEAALGDFTVTDANAYTPTEAKDLLTAEDTGHAYDPNPEEEDEITGEYVPGEVLYARRSGMLSASANRALAALGIEDSTPVYTSETTGTSAAGTPLLGSAGKTTWYRANISGDVRETVEALREIDGILDAEPNYVYTTEVMGEPSQTEIQKSWILDPSHDNGLHKGWWLRWWFWWLDLHGRPHEPLPELPSDFDSYDDYFAWLVESEDETTEVPAPGKDVVVAVIDTGVDYTHQDLAASMWVNSGEIPDNGIDDDNNGYIDDYYGIDATANPRFDGAIAGEPMDYNGHGTHVAGIIAMSCNDEGGVGAAYGSKIMAIKAGQSTGTFASADIAEAIQYAVAHGADVINMSFGGTAQSSLMKTALEDAFPYCVLVAAAGNDGLPTTDAPTPPYYKKEDIYPAGYSFVLGVMATDQSGNLAYFSNWDYVINANCEYELAAPGVSIYSTLPGNRYAEWSGTSMATPAVSAAAAVIRAAYPDKAEYSSRFIMGQLASATTKTASGYPLLDLYDSINYLPKPNLRMAQVFALDNVRAGTANDGDRILDAGETIDLGVAVRNQWGRSGTITVKADAIINDIPSPYVTFLNDTVTLDAAGTFQTVDNGVVWDDGLLCDVSNPIRFKLRDDTPNDTQILITLTVTTTNGLDETDTEVYTIGPPKPGFAFRVQRGAAIKGHISADTTLTADKYWIVENALLIDEGATLTVEPGTQIQFWSSDYEDAYGGLSMVYIDNKGTLNMVGTEDAPIEMFPGAGFENYVVQIGGIGIETLQYCQIMNPNFTGKGIVELIDHSVFNQNSNKVYLRELDSEGVKSSPSWMSVNAKTLSNSVVQNIKKSDGIGGGYSNSAIYYLDNANNNLFYNSRIYVWSNSDQSITEMRDNVVLSDENSFGGILYQSWRNAFKKMIKGRPTFSEPVTYDGAESKYVLMNPYSFIGERELAKAIATACGGTLAVIQDSNEREAIKQTLCPIFESTREFGVNDAIRRNVYVDYTFDENESRWKWGDGSAYQPAFRQDPKDGEVYSYISFLTYTYGYYDYLYATTQSYGKDFYYMMEFPVTLSDEEIMTALNNFDVHKWVDNNYSGSLYHSAVLNPILDTNTDHWTQFTAPDFTSDCYYPLHGNYWGTENSTLINKMIIDDDDYPGTLADIVETPILTLDDDLSMIYPFVTKIWVTEQGGSTVVEDAAPGQTVDVHVAYNRDMWRNEQPMISYGGEAPFTDYLVSGDWATDREWIGTAKISAVATGGNMIFRAKGGRAADDHWLECGTDQQRFQFNVNAASAQSAVLNGTGGAGKVTLNWIQNDYDLLAGYNLYRSTKADSGFTKLNDTVLTGTSYVDTDVASGVTYYYYFTMVNTDGEEIADAKSNTVAAAPLDDVPPVVAHTPVTSAKKGQALTLSAEASDNIAVSNVTLYYRVAGSSSAYTGVPMTYNSAAKRYSATIPAAAMTDAGVWYYIEARDGAGNTATGGSAAVPYVISTDSRQSLLAVTPNVLNVNAAPGNMTVYGANFNEGMTVKVGTQEIAAYTVSGDGTQITFAAPALAVGSYAIYVTKDGYTATLASAVTCQDNSSYVQLNSGEGMPGVTLRLPLYATMSGPMYALRAEIEVPAASFSAATAVQYDENFNGQFASSWRNGVLTISMVNANGIAVSAEQPVAYVELTPKAIDAPTIAQLTLRAAYLNDTSVLSAPVNVSVLVTPSYDLSVNVSYYQGGAAVSGVTVTAANVSGVTDAGGNVLLSAINRKDVSVTASKSDYDSAVNLLDALLMLQYLIGDEELTEYQLLAADVNGNGTVTEMDVVAILRKMVQLDDSFSGGAWRFVPAVNSVTLSESGNSLNFIAILVGDVDGSWKDTQ